MNTKSIGNIGEAKVLSWFVEHNIPVYLPFGDNERADLIAEFNNKLNKIQVKTSNHIKNNTINFDLFSRVHSITINGNTHKNCYYDNNEIDYYALYNMIDNEIYFIKNSEINNKSISLRFKIPKNNQSTNVKFAKDYMIDNILCVETLHEVPKDKIYGKDKVQTTM